MKVLDFGIAKVRADDADAPLTGTGSLLGTPPYMAPEQLFGESDVDHRADIWAVGLLLYQCLSGALPTGDATSNVGQVLKTIVSGPIRPLRELAEDVPADVHDIVMRMLERGRSDRPETLRETFDVLRRHTDVAVPAIGEPTERSDAPRDADARHGSPAGEPTESPAALDPASLDPVGPTQSPPPVSTSPFVRPAGRWRGVVLVGVLGLLSFIGWRWLDAPPSQPSEASGLAAPPLIATTAVELATPPSSGEPVVSPAASTSAATGPEPQPAESALPPPRPPSPHGAAKPAAPPPVTTAAPNLPPDPLGDAR